MLACICISLIKITFLFIIINFVKCRFDPKIFFVSILQSTFFLACHNSTSLQSFVSVQLQASYLTYNGETSNFNHYINVKAIVAIQNFENEKK